MLGKVKNFCLDLGFGMVRSVLMGLWIRGGVKLEVEAAFIRGWGGGVVYQYSTLLAGGSGAGK